MAPRAILGFEGALGDGALEGFDRSYPLAAIDTIGDATVIHRFARTASVIEAKFDRTPVEDNLRSLGFTAGEARHGFRIFSAEDPRAAAVRDNMLVTVGDVSSTDTTDKTPVVEAIVDARTGNGERYVDAVADCDRLVETLGSAHLLQGGPTRRARPSRAASARGWAITSGASRPASTPASSSPRARPTEAP
ncbi:hypothetical protein ACFQL4_19345 [Halosimplex aquaticum]